MSTFRNPVGPQPSGVYWRRRLAVGLGLLAVIVVILLIVFGPGASKGQSPAAPKPTNSAPVKDSTPAGPTACDKDVVEVMAVTNKAGFDADDKPELSLSIENTGAVACTFSVGADVQEYTITTGDLLIWSSKHCQTAAAPVTVTLEPGKKLDAQPIVWDRTKSSKTTCEGDRPQVKAAGASYHLEVTVAGVKSKSQQFVLY